MVEVNVEMINSSMEYVRHKKGIQIDCISSRLVRKKVILREGKEYTARLL